MDSKPPTTFKSSSKFILRAVLIFTVFVIGFYMGESSAPSLYKVQGVKNTVGQIKNVDFNIFWDAWRELENKYVGRKEIDRQKMVYGAVEGMVKAAGDPYTSFFTPEESKMLEDDISGSFSGIGAEIGFKKGALTIIAPLKGSPAQNAGLFSGDRILKIDDTFTQDLSLEEAVRKIRGEKGTEVALTIFREGFSEAKEFKIKRDIIKIPIVDWEKKGGDIAYIKIYSFIGDIDAEFRKTAREIIASGAKKIILDLRDNPGGFLDSAIEMASYFTPKGELVAIEDFGNGAERNEFRSEGYRYFDKTPVVVLINEGSASASEILAGALKDARNITLVGQKTFGKGSVQEVINLPQNTSLKVTVARWLTPSGKSIQDAGIEPDIAVEMTAEDKDQNKDPQLDKALEIIKHGT